MLRVSRQLRQSVPRFVLEFARRDVAAIYVLFGGAPLYLASLSNNATVMVVSSTVGPLIGIGFLLVRPFNPYWSLGARMEGKRARIRVPVPRLLGAWQKCSNRRQRSGLPCGRACSLA